MVNFKRYFVVFLVEYFFTLFFEKKVFEAYVFLGYNFKKIGDKALLKGKKREIDAMSLI